MTDTGDANWSTIDKALERLKHNVAEFPVGAISLDDYRPVEEKIKTIRELLTRLSARLLMVKAKRDNNLSNKIPEESIEDTYQRLEEYTTQTIINHNAAKQCLHSSTIQDILSNGEDTDLQKKMYDSLKTLFLLNDDILTMERSIEVAFKKQLDLKIECQKEILNYHSFLREQEKLRKEKLEKSNPMALRNKEKMMTKIKHINIMKKLITNLIATSVEMLKRKPFFVEMLEKHAELVNEETIIKLAENAIQ